MQLQRSIQKFANFGALTVACGAIALDPTGLTTATMSPAVASSVIAAGDLAFHFIEVKERNVCLAELKRISEKVHKEVRRHFPPDGEHYPHVMRALLEFDHAMPRCAPSPSEIVHSNMNPQSITILIINRLAEQHELFRPIDTSDVALFPAPDVANEVIRKLVLETLICLTESKEIFAALNPHVAQVTLLRLEELIVASINSAHQQALIAGKLDAFGEDLRFVVHTARLQKLAEEASTAIKKSQKDLPTITEAVRALEQHVG